MERCCSRTVILNKFWMNNFSLHKQWFPTSVRLNNWNLVRKEPYSICVWRSRINYTDVTCQWSIEPFVRDFVVDRQPGFLGNGTEFYSVQNFESTPLEIRTNKTVEGNSKRSSRSSGNHVSCIGLGFITSEHLVEHSNRKSCPLRTASFATSKLASGCAWIDNQNVYSHTNNTLAFQPNLPHLCNVIRLPKQKIVDHHHTYLTKLLSKYRLHVSAYKSHHHLSNMWVSTYNHVDTHILAGGT
jgi:hypothetical protein